MLNIILQVLYTADGYRVLEYIEVLNCRLKIKLVSCNKNRDAMGVGMNTWQERIVFLIDFQRKAILGLVDPLCSSS